MCRALNAECAFICHERFRFYQQVWNPQADYRSILRVSHTARGRELPCLCVFGTDSLSEGGWREERAREISACYWVNSLLVSSRTDRRGLVHARFCLGLCWRRDPSGTLTHAKLEAGDVSFLPVTTSRAMSAIAILQRQTCPTLPLLAGCMCAP